MTTLAEQFQDFAECCLSLARTAKTAAGRARFLQMAHEYRLATLRVLQEELSSDQKVGNADLAPIGRAFQVTPRTLDHAHPIAERNFR